MAITLVRHTTPDVVSGTCYGRTDLALADTYQDEFEKVLASVPDCSQIISSPLIRCRHLATAVSVQLNSEIHIVKDWIEMDFGSWEGVPWADIPRTELDDWSENFRHFNGHNGESVAMLEHRVRRGLAAVPDNSIVVTHAGCIKAACAIHDIQDRWDTETPFGGIVSLP